MKILRIFTYISLVLTLFACVAVQEKTPEQMSMEATAKMDKNISTHSRTFSEVSAKLRAINTTTCPYDFAYAHDKLQEAWEKLSIIEEKMYGEDMQKASKDIEEFLRERSKDAKKSLAKLKKYWKNFSEDLDKATDELDVAKENLKKIGEKYGAKIESVVDDLDE